MASVVEVPEEVCDLNPQKTCRFTTKLVPKLTPKEECTVIPRETCHLSFSAPVAGKKPLITKWCMDDDKDILLGLEQTGGAVGNTDADDDSSSSAFGGALVPPAAGPAASEISANVPTPYSSEGAATIPSRESLSNDNGSFQQNSQAGGQRGAGNAERKRPSVQQGQTRPNIQGQGGLSNGLLGKPSRSEPRKPTRNGGQERPNNKDPSKEVQGRPNKGIQKRPNNQIRPANAGQRRLVNGGNGSEDQRKPSNVGKEKPNNGRPAKVRPTNIGQRTPTRGSQQRPSDVPVLRTTNEGQRKPTNQGKERIVYGRIPGNQEGQGTLSNAIKQGIQNLGRPSYGTGGQGNPNTEELTSDPNSVQVEEAQPGYGTERPLQGNPRQPSFSVSVGELLPPPKVDGRPSSPVNTVASPAPEAYLPPPSLDYPSSEDLSFGLPQDNPSYGNEAIIGTHASGPRPLPGQLADLSDLPDLEDYYDQLPNSLQSYYDQAEDYYYDQYDQDLDLAAAPVAPDTGYGSPGRRQTRRVDALRRGWMSYQELLG